MCWMIQSNEHMLTVSQMFFKIIQQFPVNAEGWLSFNRVWMHININRKTCSYHDATFTLPCIIIYTLLKWYAIISSSVWCKVCGLDVGLGVSIKSKSSRVTPESFCEIYIYSYFQPLCLLCLFDTTIRTDTYTFSMCLPSWTHRQMEGEPLPFTRIWWIPSLCSEKMYSSFFH